MYKLARGDEDGKVALGFGIVFSLLVAAAYFFSSADMTFSDLSGYFKNLKTLRHEIA